MDAERFDRIARNCDRWGWTRRGVTGAVFGAALVSVRSRPIPESVAKRKGKKKPKKCRNGTVKCGKSCVNTKTNALHCGQCGNRCGDGRACVGGECQSGCPGDQILCNALCVDPNDNEAHCGRCNNPCPGDLTCIDGECACAGTICGNACVDTETDDDHCGGCGVRCIGGHHCTPFGCRCPGVAGVCVSPLTCCEHQRTCANLSLSNSHCGACGQPCATGTACCGGRCADLNTDKECCGERRERCEDGEICCSFCRDPDTLLTDGDNCGACGTSCRDILGPEPLYPYCCGGGCVDIQEDRNNCGGCDIVCDTGYECVSMGAGNPPARCIQVAGGGE
jgi:hypothetical protein